MQVNSKKEITIEISNDELNALEDFFCYYYPNGRDNHMTITRNIVIDLWTKLVKQFDAPDIKK